MPLSLSWSGASSAPSRQRRNEDRTIEPISLVIACLAADRSDFGVRSVCTSQIHVDKRASTLRPP
jgi:hypothetical protein